MQKPHRIRLKLPQPLPFSCHIAVRITDLNYGNHVGNDRVLQYLHEARVQFFDEMNYTEIDFGGQGIIMADAAIQYRKELKYPSLLQVSIGVISLTERSFTLGYRLVCEPKEQQKKQELIAEATTTLVGFNYEIGKPAAFSPLVVSALNNYLV